MISEIPGTVTIRHHRVEQSRAIDMDLQTIVVRPFSDAGDLGQRPDSAPALIGGVLDADQSGDAIVLIVGTHLSFQVVDIQQPALPPNRPNRDPAEGRRSAGLQS